MEGKYPYEYYLILSKINNSDIGNIPEEYYTEELLINLANNHDGIIENIIKKYPKLLTKQIFMICNDKIEWFISSRTEKAVIDAVLKTKMYEDIDVLHGCLVQFRNHLSEDFTKTISEDVFKKIIKKYPQFPMNLGYKKYLLYLFKKYENIIPNIKDVGKWVYYKAFKYNVVKFEEIPKRYLSDESISEKAIDDITIIDKLDKKLITAKVIGSIMINTFDHIEPLKILCSDKDLLRKFVKTCPKLPWNFLGRFLKCIRTDKDLMNIFKKTLGKYDVNDEFFVDFGILGDDFYGMLPPKIKTKKFYMRILEKKSDFVSIFPEELKCDSSFFKVEYKYYLQKKFSEKHGNDILLQRCYKKEFTNVYFS